MSLPLSIESRFNETYEGLRAARFQSAAEAHNMETSLKWLSKSFKTKIVKVKKKREYLVMIVEPVSLIEGV